MDLPDAATICLQIQGFRGVQPTDPYIEGMIVALELQLQELDMDNNTSSHLSTFDPDFESDREIVLSLAIEDEIALALDKQPLWVETDCTICTSRISGYQIFEAPCAHSYCHDCLRDLFELTIRDESHYLPSCCRLEIVLGPTVVPILGGDLTDKFNEKKVEYNTEHGKRTYCCGSNCGAFVPEPAIQDGVATCLDCGRRTCTICKEAAHRGDCPKDEDTQSVLELASREGWQRCYNAKCRRIVSLAVGCNHMT
ncbi:unnamed protein product [Aureobasidium mustum]|uniref:RBR-type E3 ubiquitin transferase n=1 Tax=Aureobasidium mustum TaxID=2773714 RepID=A0A9N8JWH7_9PEZI|nr:unnamed protein product [Aureobasidium mustum]